ncbi:MAG: hypothetical protein AMXMBFR19_23950 [Chthonomonadaceae bacterium]|uniref:Glycosyltransferase n=1 Tax=Candidatus Nitrosymbiomonas proteolyticus TaxID=2608984 RepID=A0A809RK13_9BACT|nr:glycosyltransferase [Candidatus Nitrosymbiomonas proteolyticus]
MKNTLSLCLLVRNESANVGTAIKSFEGLVDEVVVVDTGSADDTREVARNHGAAVLDYPWRDDFAAVRNFLFSSARCDWIFHLDADETLLPGSDEEIRTLIRRPEAQGAYVLRQDLFSADDPSQFTQMLQLRLFRSEGLPQQVGRCHPHFEPPLEDVARSLGRQVVLSNVRLRHTGYVAELKPAKLERSARLLELELQDRPGQFYYQVELATTLMQLGSDRANAALLQACETLRPHISAPTAPSHQAALLLEVLLQIPEHNLPGGWSKDQVRELSARWFPNSAPLAWLRASFEFREGRFESARETLEHLRAMAENESYDKTTSFHPRIFGPELHLNLGVCYARLGELNEAVACFEGLRNTQFAGFAEQNLAAIRDLQRQFESEA